MVGEAVQVGAGARTPARAVQRHRQDRLPRRARILHPAAFGRCPHPTGTTTRPDKAPPSRSYLLAADAGSGDGGSTLTPGRAGWSR
jgi:hypothetical protein